MADDIVTRLRRITAKPLGMVIDPPPHPLCQEAADEIERLRAEIERLRQLGDTLAYFVRSGEGKEMYSAVYAWEEARRG